MDTKIKYDAVYKFGNTTVNIVAPPPMTEEVDRSGNREVLEYHSTREAAERIAEKMNEEVTK